MIIKKLLFWAFKGIGSNGIEYSFALIKLSLLPATFVVFVNSITDWYIENSIYVKWVLIFVALDWTLITIYYLFKVKKFSLFRSIMYLLTKILVVLSAWAVMNALDNALIDVTFILIYLSAALKVAILLYPVIPFLQTIDKLTNGNHPFGFLMRAIDRFMENGNLNELKTTKENNYGTTEFFKDDTDEKME